MNDYNMYTSVLDYIEKATRINLCPPGCTECRPSSARFERRASGLCKTTEQVRLSIGVYF